MKLAQNVPRIEMFYFHDNNGVKRVNKSILKK